MSYSGNTASIPLGQLGLHTDDPMSLLPPNAAITANNVSLFTSRLEKSGGSQPYKSMAALSAGVVGVFDWLPTPTAQRLVVATVDGKIWRDTGDGTFGTATPIKTGLGTLDATMAFCSGGAEEATRNKKLFAYTQSLNQIQVLSGDGSSMTAIAHPSIDWSAGNYPTFGFIFNGRHFVLGASNNRHTLYWSGAAIAQNPQAINTNNASLVLTGFSSVNGIQAGYTVTGANIPAGTTVASRNTGALTVTLSAMPTSNASVNDLIFTPPYTGQDHENFEIPALNAGASSPGSQTVFSGEADGLISAFIYKGVAMLFKRPFGAYVMDFSDTLSYSITKYSNSFGIASPHAACQMVDDLIAGNNEGSLTSLKATLAFGSFETGDALQIMRVRDYVRTNTSYNGLSVMHAIYYPEKQIAYFSTKSAPSASAQDRMLVVDVSKGTPRMTLETKDLPSCLGLQKDANNVLRPMYGSTDGKVYLMDQSEHSVNGAAYTGEFQTPFIDFSYMDQTLADKNKLFDFLSVSFVSVGAWSFYVDVFVDGSFVETITYPMTGNGALDSFILDVSRLGSFIPKTLRKPLHCAGRTISFRIYNGMASQYFKIDKIMVGFRVSAEQNKGSKG